jgi:hypothetical protein
MTYLDSIYLNKRGNDSETGRWAYYRITSLGGELGDHIEVCTLEWPSLEDINVVGDEKKAPVINPADTGFNSAYPNVCDLLRSKWKIDHEKSVLIGMRGRP